MKKNIKWKIIARHKWVSGCIITESFNVDDDSMRRFTATIRGWRNWLIYEGEVLPEIPQLVQKKVREIRDRIDSNDESVFTESCYIQN